MKNLNLIPYYFKDEANAFTIKNGIPNIYLRYNATNEISAKYHEFVKSLNIKSEHELRKDAEKQGVTFTFTGYKTHCDIDANGFLFSCTNQSSYINDAIKIMKFCGIID
jgi:hypothetical protein